MFISNYYWQFWCFLSSTTHKNRAWTHLNWFQWASVWVIDLVFKHCKCDAACHVRTTETSVHDKNQHWRRTSSASKTTWSYLCTWPVLQFQTSSKIQYITAANRWSVKSGFSLTCFICTHSFEELFDLVQMRLLQQSPAQSATNFMVVHWANKTKRDKHFAYDNMYTHLHLNAANWSEFAFGIVILFACVGIPPARMQFSTCVKVCFRTSDHCLNTKCPCWPSSTASLWPDHAARFL